MRENKNIPILARCHRWQDVPSRRKQFLIATLADNLGEVAKLHEGPRMKNQTCGKPFQVTLKVLESRRPNPHISEEV